MTDIVDRLDALAVDADPDTAAVLAYAIMEIGLLRHMLRTVTKIAVGDPDG